MTSTVLDIAHPLSFQEIDHLWKTLIYLRPGHQKNT
jgi:hypothetical protein